MDANIRVLPRGEGIERSLAIPLPAGQVVATTLVVTKDVKELPTLSSVEHVIARLANLGLVLADPRESERIAHLINKKFLPVEQAKWKDQDLPLRVERASGAGQPEALRAVGAVRAPILTAANVALTAGGAYGPVERRANEIRLVDEVSHAVTNRKAVWLQYGTIAAAFVGKTVLEQLIQQLIGIPLIDIVRSTLRGAGRLVF